MAGVGRRRPAARVRIAHRYGQQTAAFLYRLLDGLIDRYDLPVPEGDAFLLGWAIAGGDRHRAQLLPALFRSSHLRHRPRIGAELAAAVDDGAVSAHLAWEQLVDPAALARATGLAPADVDAGLARLAAAGRVGFDLAERSWFHRELPVDTDEVLLRRNPRLAAARRLVEAGAVSGGPTAWRVQGDERTHDVERRDDRLRCTCAWEREHQGSRGPCKHILAVLLAT